MKIVVTSVVPHEEDLSELGIAKNSGSVFADDGRAVTRLTTCRATCVRCGEQVTSSHPLQISLAVGAAGVHLDPCALPLAAGLDKANASRCARPARCWPIVSGCA